MSDLDLAVYGAIDREQTGQQVHDAVESGRQGLVRHKPDLEHADERTPVGAEQRQAATIEFKYTTLTPNMQLATYV